MLRKELLDSLKHKYGGSISEVQNYCSQALQELDKLENAEEILALKHKEKNEMLSHAQTKFDILSKIRKQHALELEKNIEEGLKELGIEKAKFKVNFIKLANSIFDVNQYSINCLEDVEFLFSANMGEELKPLSKIISGGEMNRFMLIFKNILAQNNGSQTLIFDEVDSGISGQIAVSVANKIAKLSKKYQILCITHLPQVAAMGDNFYFVFKSQIDGRTQTFIKQLSEDEIIKEISILTYGSVDSKKLELTSELIKNNYIYKSSLE